MKLFGNFNKPIRLRKNILKTIVRLQGQSIYDEMSYNVVYLFPTPNLGNYQADMTISPLALNQSKILKYFQQIIQFKVFFYKRVYYVTICIMTYQKVEYNIVFL